MKSVVLVDDDHRFISQVRNIVSECSGFTIVAEASSGREGMLVVEHFRPDLVILDIIMPDDNGLKLLRHIREGCERYNPYVYIMTAMDTPAIQQISSDFNTDFFDRKPINEKKVAKNLGYVCLAEPKPLSAAAKCPVKNLSDVIDEVMNEFQIPSRLLGREYIECALFFMADDPTKKRNVYRKISEVFDCTTKGAARNIMSAVEATKDSEKYRSVFGEDRVENLIFLTEMSAIVRKRMQGREPD